MKIDEREKVNILLNLLNERYNASHKMRERSQNFATWVLGIGIAVIGLLLSGKALDLLQKCLLTLFTGFICLLTIYFLKSMEIGFKKNRKVMIDLEDILGCYRIGEYVDSKPLFPPEYADQKEHLSKCEKIKSRLRSHFMPMYAWIVVVALMVILMVWFSPTPQN